MWISSSLETVLTPTAIALGNFDGIHCGHRRVIAPVLLPSDLVLPLNLALPDGSAAVGEFVELGDSLDILDLGFQLKLNDVAVQDGHTKDMIFNINQIIAYTSKFFTLNVGDLIFTGTPAGVGPVKIDDILEGYLQGKKVLEVCVK